MSGVAAGMIASYGSSAVGFEVIYTGSNSGAATGFGWTYASMGVTIQAGDLVLVGRTVDLATSADNSTGYTTIDEQTGGNPDTIVEYRNLTGGETGVNVGSWNSSTYNHQAVVVAIIRGADTSSGTSWQDATPTIATSGGGDPNPGAITVATAGSIVVVMGFLDDDVLTSVSGPSGYLGTEWAGGGGNSGTNESAMIAYQIDLPTGSEDPGTFTTDGDDAWVAATLAIKAA